STVEGRWKTPATSTSATRLRNLRLEDAGERAPQAGDGAGGGAEVALAQPPAAILVDVRREAITGDRSLDAAERALAILADFVARLGRDDFRRERAERVDGRRDPARRDRQARRAQRRGDHLVIVPV